MESGVATRPITDFRAYREQLGQYVFRSGLVMKPLFERARAEPKRVVYAEGEEDRVLRAVQVALDDGIAIPIVIGRRERIQSALQQLGLAMRPDRDFELIDPFDNPHYKECWQEYHRLRERFGVDPSNARIRINTRTTVLGAVLVKLGYGDALICGAIGSYQGHLKHVTEVMSAPDDDRVVAGLTLLITSKGTLFLADTHVNVDPSAEQIVDITRLAAEEVRRFGIAPKIALLSHSNFGSWASEPARKMARALRLLRERAPELEVEGEMQADIALSEALRARVFPRSQLEGAANLLIMPTLDAANISFNLLRSMTDGVAVGPMLLGLDAPAHVIPKTSSTRRIVNMTAVAVVDAQVRSQSGAAGPPVAAD